ncbi:AraC family transcriptional regulator [Paenibacillus hemerocallicola]|uniref:AraC family transcriptional regulator n=1 Tax=Paenibacillus hemerocallicola TaxID=1172614 RepID=A0A5C4SYB0_9BACL|nr:AraC family transcriptional regulator [Paenibacillus hemerocallicola]
MIIIFIKSEVFTLSQTLQDKPVPAFLDDLWFKLRSVDMLRDGKMEQQLIESHALIVVKSGAGLLTADIRESRLRQEAVFIALPGQTMGVSPEAAAELELYIIKFDVYRDDEPIEAFPLNGEIPIYAETHTSGLCEAMYGYSRSEHALERFRGQSAFQELLYWLMKHIRPLPDADSRSALDRTKAYIDTCYNESLTIEQLARMAGISPKYYVDLFKKTYGISAIDYVTEVRVERAKQFMFRSDARLRDVAHQVGYHDEFYFSRKFKKEVGVSPTVYMKNRKRKIAAYTSPVLGHLLALKMIPYAAPLHPKWTAYYYKAYRSDIPLHLSAYRFNRDWESNIEALAQAQPDMVICGDILHPDEKKRLEEQFPVFYIQGENNDWREQLRLTAQIVGVPLEADSWLRYYDRNTKFARERIEREWRNDTVLVLSIYKQSYYVCPTRGMRDVLYEDLKLNRPKGYNPSVYNQAVALEQFAEFDADRILLNVCQESESLNHWRWLQASPAWRDLKAVRRNHVYVISSDPWREYSAHACERMVDDLLKLLDGERQAVYAY